MVEDHLKGWLVSRLTLAERLNLQRVDEQMDRYPLAPGARQGRCVCCNVYLKPTDLTDHLCRCATCRARRRMEGRGKRPT